jgi:hypothetical protein
MKILLTFVLFTILLIGKTIYLNKGIKFTKQKTFEEKESSKPKKSKSIILEIEK